MKSETASKKNGLEQTLKLLAIAVPTVALVNASWQAHGDLLHALEGHGVPIVLQSLGSWLTTIAALKLTAMLPSALLIGSLALPAVGVPLLALGIGIQLYRLDKEGLRNLTPGQRLLDWCRTIKEWLVR